MSKIEKLDRMSAKHLVLCLLAVMVSSAATSAIVGTWAYVVMQAQMRTWVNFSGAAAASLDHKRGITNMCEAASESKIGVEPSGSQRYSKVRYWKVFGPMDQKFIEAYNARMREENKAAVRR